MSSFFEIIRTLILVGGALLGLFLYFLSTPNSKLREVMMPIVGWCFAIFCGIYVLSPIDILPEAFLGPFGLFDDVGAVVAGIVAARAAMSAGKGKKQHQDETASREPAILNGTARRID
jgi:uncharacterized membrane protein YkvA (DUF1232 family)